MPDGAWSSAALVWKRTIAAFGRTCASVPAAALLAGALALAWCGGSSAAQSHKLNGSMVRPYRGAVDDVQLSPDGVWAIYRGYSEAGQYGGFSVPTKGGNPIPLDVAWPGHSFQQEISPDSRYLVYAVNGLYCSPIDGSRGPSLLAASASSFAFSADGTYVVYLEGRALFRVALDGSDAPLRLTETYPAAVTTGSFRVSRGSRGMAERVVFLADAGTDNVSELYSVPLDASAPPVKLNGPFASFSDAWFFDLSPTGERVIYLADPVSNDRFDLYSVPSDGSAAPVVLSTARINNSGQIKISPDGRWVAFLAEASLGVFDLFTVPIAGGEPDRLNPPLPQGGDVSSSFQISASSDRLVYLADQDENDVFELFSAPIDGSTAAVEIDHDLQPGEDVWSFELSGERVVYRAGLGAHTGGSLYSGPIVGGTAPVAISGSPAPWSWHIAPDGESVAFVARDSTGFSRGLYAVPIQGGSAPVLLDAAGRDLIGITADGSRVVYKADPVIESALELFSVPLDASRSAVPLNHPMAAMAVADVLSFQVGPDGERCAFTVVAETCDCDDSGVFELHSAGIDPSAPSTRIAPFEVGAALFTPDGSRLVFQSRLYDGDNYGGLFSAPADGAVEPLELEPAAGHFVLLPDGVTVVFDKANPMAGIYRRPVDGSSPATLLALGEVETLLLSPDGARVVFMRRIASAYELYSVPTDGSGPVAQLNDLTSPLGNMPYPFAVTPNGARVYYAIDQQLNDVAELFSVPIDGSASPTKLSGTLVPGGDVYYYSILVAPDSTRLVYSADALVDNRWDLFSVPVDGSTAPVRLNPPLVAGGFIRDTVVTADSARVIYRADQAVDEVYELFSVPIDAAAPPVRLNAPLSAGGDVSVFESTWRPAFALTPDGARVVYSADQVVDERFELFAAAVDGSGTPQRLGGPSIANGDVRERFQIVAEGERVLYFADHETDEVVELYEASIEGGKARKLNAPLVAGGDVDMYKPPRITPDGKWILYVADQDTDSVQELYGVPMSAHPPAASASARTPTHSRGD